jgi:hypothetical protein
MTLVQARLDQVSTHSFLQPVVAIHASTGDVVLRAVHSKPPDPSGAVGWRSGLADLRAWRQRQPQDRTWPQGRALIGPFIQLDHVLARGLSVVDAGVVHLPNTDHASVWTHLSPSHS